MTRYSVVLTTVSSEEEASKLAKSLVDSRLAACVSIIPNVTSVYNWKDQMQQDKEFMLMIKTASGLIHKLQAHFAGNHPYQVPEFLVLKIDEGSAAYLGWMEGWLRPKVAGQSKESQVASRRSKQRVAGRRSKVETRVAGRKSQVKAKSRKSQVESRKSSNPGRLTC